MDTMEQNQNIIYPSYLWLPSCSQIETLVEGKPPLYFDLYSIFETRIRELENRIEKLEQKREQQIIPIQFLESEKLHLRQPIAVSLSYSSEGKIWIVDCPELNLYGEGEDEQRAIDDFKNALEEFYFSLKKDKERLGPDLKKRWDILQKIIDEKSK
jgi:hypothetical protein